MTSALTMLLLLHLADPPAPPAAPPEAAKLFARFEALWEDPAALEAELRAIRAQNPEWDFMHRTFLVLGAANLALGGAIDAPRALALIDRVIDDTLAREAEGGVHYFLMPYSKAGEWIVTPPRSQFVDGEIAMMLAARRLLEDSPRHRALHQRRSAWIAARMAPHPTRSAESYPDECWTFCNAIALAALRVGDLLDGTDHGPLTAAWLAATKRMLTDEASGLMISAYTPAGVPTSSGAGPEGSTIWLVAHMLQVFAPEVAADQYARARRGLGRSLMGLGWSLEWLPADGVEPDVDSGALVPGILASTSASGLALVASRAFGDTRWHDALRRSLALAGPQEEDGRLHYAASNLVGDAVILYGLSNGPLWDLISRRGERGTRAPRRWGAPRTSQGPSRAPASAGRTPR
jgi:hypothetical protein